MSDIVTLLPAGTGSGVTGATIDAGDLVRDFTIELAVSAATTAMSVTFQGSLDGTVWQDLPGLQVVSAAGAESAAVQPYVTNAAGAGSVAFVSAAAGGAWRFFRAVTGTITGATVGATLAFERD